MNVLVTGGTGYIGSHTVVELIGEGHNVIVLDNLSNSKKEVINKIERITNVKPKFYEEDLLNKDKIDKIFKESQIDAVMHFAGLKAVGESVEKPLDYYNNNIIGTLNLLEVMKRYNVKKIIFSSSATVYGNPNKLPITEEMPLSTTNPYGSTKLMIEQILKDLYISDNNWSIVLLRYFNPVGSHESALIGENPNGIPNNLVPYILKVANKELEKLYVFGNDYNTPDGTGVRDYIHVVDLAKGHIKALDKKIIETGVHIYNLGTGRGYSVLEIVHNFIKTNKIDVPYEIVDRRAGDIDSCYADSSKAKDEIRLGGRKRSKANVYRCMEFYTKH